METKKTLKPQLLKKSSKKSGSRRVVHFKDPLIIQESVASRAKRADHIVALLQKNYPEARCALNYKNAFELLVATILSAQCTDDRVNQITPALFQHYPHATAMAQAQLESLEELIRSAGFYKNKSKSLRGASQALVEKHGGSVPPVMEDLVELPGVGRKTANVVLGNAFRIASGVVVDTHVTRLSNRLGLAYGQNAVLLEKELNVLIETRHWIDFSHWLIIHGRTICKARKPHCEKCFLISLCPTGSQTQRSPKASSG